MLMSDFTEDPYLGEGARPILRRGGTATGCLCIHGFSAAPTEISWLGDHLYTHQNMTTYSVRLAGHGADPTHMQRMSWQDWYLSVWDGYQLLADQCEQVHVAGISMGGLLTLLLAASEAKIASAAVIAAPIFFKSKQVHFAKYLKWFRRMTHMPDVTNLPEIVRAEQAKRGETVLGRTHYDMWSVGAVAQMVRLSEVVNARLEHIEVPLALIYAAQDGAVQIESSDYIAQHVRSETVQQHLLEESGHIITQDIERETAFKLVEEFFRQPHTTQPTTE